MSEEPIERAEFRIAPYSRAMLPSFRWRPWFFAFGVAFLLAVWATYGTMWLLLVIAIAYVVTGAAYFGYTRARPSDLTLAEAGVESTVVEVGVAQDGRLTTDRGQMFLDEEGLHFVGHRFTFSLARDQIVAAWRESKIDALDADVRILTKETFIKVRVLVVGRRRSLEIVEQIVTLSPPTLK